MRRHRLLNAIDGSAPVEAIFAMALTLLLALGVVQVALTLYARNVVVSAVHEGARAAVELGGDPADATRVARETIARSAGGLVDELAVDVSVVENGDEVELIVQASADLRAVGPLPISVPVDATATAGVETAR